AEAEVRLHPLCRGADLEACRRCRPKATGQSVLDSRTVRFGWGRDVLHQRNEPALLPQLVQHAGGLVGLVVSHACLVSSYSAIDAAAETFRLSILPGRRSPATSSQVSRVNRRRPSPSAPSTSAARRPSSPGPDRGR